MNRSPVFLLVGLAALVGSGCSLKRMGVNTTAEILDDGIAAFEAEPDPVLAHEAAAAQIKLLESLHRADPANERVLLGLARAFGGYAFLFLEAGAEKDTAVRKRAADLYVRGAAYGMDLLERRLGKGTIDLAAGGSLDAWRQRLSRGGRGDLPALFWTGYNWAGEIRKRVDLPAAVAGLPKAVALVERATALDPSYNFGSPHLFMGVYYGERPKMIGGDPKKSKFHFDEADRLAGGRFVMGKFLFARSYAVQTQDAALFTKLLTEVLSAPDNLLPEQRLSQEVAKNWARLYLNRKTDFFAED